MSEAAADDTIIWESLAALAWPWRLAAILVQAHNSDESYGRLWSSGKSFSGRAGLGNDEEKGKRLYEEARMVRAEIDALWNEAQATDVAVKGAVSATETTTFRTVNVILRSRSVYRTRRSGTSRPSSPRDSVDSSGTSNGQRRNSKLDPAGIAHG